MPIQPFQPGRSPDHPPDSPRDDAAGALDPASARVLELEAELRELQHRAKNSLQLVVNLLKLQTGRIRDPDARAAYEQTLVRIEALAILFRQLHETGMGTHVKIGPYVAQVCETVKAGTPGTLAKVPVTVDAEAMEVGLYDAMPLGVIVAELVSNALRHAFPEQGWITVTLARLGEKRGRLTVEDNGRTLPVGFDTTTDDGLMLAEALANQFGDTLAIDGTPNGTTATVSFPL